MKLFSKISVKITALVAVIMFFFPLCSVSCSGVEVIEFTGVELAVGKAVDMPDIGIEIEEIPQKLDGSPLVLAAIILAGIAFICALLLGISRIFSILTGLSSVASLAIMIIVMIGIDKKIADEAGMVATVNFHIPYYILLISLGATAVMGFLSFALRGKSNKYYF